MYALEPKQIMCPYCGETIHISVDTSIIDQRYTEDCSVCCRPMVVHIVIQDEMVSVSAYSESEC